MDFQSYPLGSNIQDYCYLVRIAHAYHKGLVGTDSKELKNIVKCEHTSAREYNSKKLIENGNLECAVQNE